MAAPAVAPAARRGGGQALIMRRGAGDALVYLALAGGGSLVAFPFLWGSTLLPFTSALLICDRGADLGYCCANICAGLSVPALPLLNYTHS